MIDTSLSDKAALKRYRFEPFGEFSIAASGETHLSIFNDTIADADKGVYAWVIDDDIVRIGSCKGSLLSRSKAHSRWIEMRLQGIAKISDPMKLENQTQEARRWQQALAGGKIATVWGRSGTLVETPIGPLNTYLAEENALLEAYRPKFNNSFFR